MVDVVAVRSNSVVHDPRLAKIATSLNRRYSTLVLGWNREGISRDKVDKYIADVRLFNLRAPDGKLSIVAYYPLFWTWVLWWLFIYRPKVVHSCDLDTFIPSYIYRCIFRKKLVFDVFDRFVGMLYRVNISKKFKALKLESLYSFVSSLEEQFANNADVLITVSENILKTFRRRPICCPIIMNCSDDLVRDKTKFEDDRMFKLYTGNIARYCGLETITASIEDLDNVELLISGRLMDKELLKELQKSSKIKYKGFLRYSDYLALEGGSDVVVILYDTKVPLNQFRSPNKIFEAMSFGLPVITNLEADLVNKIGNGIIVDYDDMKQVKEAIVCLRDNIELRRSMGGNGRKAFLREYNWPAMEQELYKTYEYLLPKQYQDSKAQ